jgi:hypothetical protein
VQAAWHVVHADADAAQSVLSQPCVWLGCLLSMYYFLNISAAVVQLCVWGSAGAEQPSVYQPVCDVRIPAQYDLSSLCSTLRVLL